ncbi:hypothetical protein H0O00_01005 [Candidatus Micrarchaeota archaeon]|nr:hypothetical protein [Candidatus Micrarchaeota archaeon]
MEMLRVRTIEDVVILDGFVQGITRGLSYPTGSLLKISAHYLPNFGFELSDDNQAGFEALSLKKYFEGWERAAKVTLDTIKEATRKAGFPVDNSHLNVEVGKIVVELLMNLAKADKTRQFFLTDIGSGDGETTSAVLDAICNEGAFELAERCEFMLVEPSGENAWNAVNSLKGNGKDKKGHRINKEHKVSITMVSGTNHDFLGRLNEGESDIIYSNAVFHHMIFPTYLDTLREGLAADGVLVIGDWYTTIFKHPALIAEILEDLGIDKVKLGEFRSLFNCSEGDEKKVYAGEDMRDEIITNYRMKHYIVGIGNAFLTIPEENRDEFLEGHCAFKDRKEDLEKKGFVTDSEALGEHPAFGGIKNNVRDVDPYGAAKVGAFAKAAKPPAAANGGQDKKQKLRAAA